MKVLDARLDAYRLPYRRTVEWSDSVESAADYVLLTLATDDGRTGIAEVTVKRTWSGVSVRSVVAAVEDLFLPALRVACPDTDAALIEFVRSVPDNSAAKCLVATALDMILRSGDSPMEALDVPVSWAVTRQSPSRMAAEAAEMVSRHGFGTLKVKGGQGVATDAHAVREIRAAVGEGVVLTIDANSAYPPVYAQDYVQEMCRAGVRVVEDPVAHVPDAHFAALMMSPARQALLVDFSCATAWHAQSLLSAGCRALNIKPGRYGLPEARHIAQMARQVQARACIGLFGESALGTLINLQLARTDPALTTYLPAELTFFLTLQAQVTDHELQVRNGVLRIPPLHHLPGLVDGPCIKRFAL